jgi:hypothetical protein
MLAPFDLMDRQPPISRMDFAERAISEFDRHTVQAGVTMGTAGGGDLSLPPVS